MSGSSSATAMRKLRFMVVPSAVETSGIAATPEAGSGASSGQGDFDGGPGTIIGGHFDAAAVGFDDALGDRHAQPGAARFGRVKRHEYLLMLFGGQPRSVVADDDADRFMVAQLRGSAVDLDADRIGAGGQRVLQDVTENALDRKRIDAAAEIDQVDSLLQAGLSVADAGVQLTPGFPPQRGQ